MVGNCGMLRVMRGGLGHLDNVWNGDSRTIESLANIKGILGDFSDGDLRCVWGQGVLAVHSSTVERCRQSVVIQVQPAAVVDAFK